LAARDRPFWRNRCYPVLCGQRVLALPNHAAPYREREALDQLRGQPLVPNRAALLLYARLLLPTRFLFVQNRACAFRSAGERTFCVQFRPWLPARDRLGELDRRRRMRVLCTLSFDLSDMRNPSAEAHPVAEHLFQRSMLGQPTQIYSCWKNTFLVPHGRRTRLCFLEKFDAFNSCEFADSEEVEERI